ncbi:MAG TPA: CmcI family methyltransferase [Burkholderiaceae bacterium]|jgi:cephalosporin hydroxylase
MIQIDLQAGTLRTSGADGEATWPIGSPQAFRLLSRAWLRSGWDAKYVYGFSWMGRPIIQLPEDLVRMQEVIHRIGPDVLVETGIAHGGSLVFYASLFKASDKGRVIGVDIEIRPHNRRAIEAHPLAGLIHLIEGSSIDPAVVARVRAQMRSGERGLVVLDANHTRAHVLAELRAYAEFVAVDSYIVACDGIMQEVVGAPRTQPGWATDNPQAAVADFLAERDDFVLEEPAFPFNEGAICERVTYWPNAFLRRVR